MTLIDIVIGVLFSACVLALIVAAWITNDDGGTG